MNSVIAPFFNYGHGNDQLLWRFFLLHCNKWSKYVDKIYIIDSGCNLDPSDNPRIEIIRKPPASHWENINEAIRRVPDGNILLLDSDIIIYDPEVIARGFKDLDEYDGVGIFDSSGGLSMSNYELMRENENRFERRRFCPYLFFLRKGALRPDFDFTPRGGEFWTDSMGTVTEQLLADGKKIKELQDDRATISLEDDGRITSLQWLDTPPKKWALDEHLNLGYYHIRNFGGGLKIFNRGAFDEVPGREARRLLTWVVVLGEKVKDQALLEKYRFVFGNEFSEYLKEFKKYHSFLDKI